MLLECLFRKFPNIFEACGRRGMGAHARDARNHNMEGQWKDAVPPTVINGQVLD